MHRSLTYATGHRCMRWKRVSNEFLFRIEQALELTRPEPDAAHLHYVQDQLAALEDAVISLEAC